MNFDRQAQSRPYSIIIKTHKDFASHFSYTGGFQGKEESTELKGRVYFTKITLSAKIIQWDKE